MCASNLKAPRQFQPQQTVCARADIHESWGYGRLLVLRAGQGSDRAAKPSVTPEAPYLGLISVAVTRYVVCGVL